MKVLLKCNIKQIFKLKSIYIVYSLLTLINIVSYSLLIFVGKNDKIENKLSSLQVGFYFFIINLFFIVIFTLLINTNLFYSSIYSGKINMEIINGLNKKTIWLSRFITQKIILLNLIIIQITIVNLIMLMYDKALQGYLINQRLFYWLFLIFFLFFLDFIYHICIGFIKQQAFVAAIMFVVGLFFTVSLICNYFFKQDNINNFGLIKSNKAYIKNNLIMENYNAFINLSENKTANLVKDWHKLNLQFYVENKMIDNFSNEINIIKASAFYDDFIRVNKQNIFISFIDDQYKILEDNPKLFNMNFNSLLKLNSATYAHSEEVPIIKKILENFYLVTNNSSYLNILNNYIARYSFPKFTEGNQSYLYSYFKSPTYILQNNKYEYIKKHPEIALLIDLYSNILDEFYDLKNKENYNSYIYDLYIAKNNLESSFYNRIRWNLFNQLSKMAYGYKDYLYEYLIANEPFGPLSDYYYKRLVNDSEKIDRYRNINKFFESEETKKENNFQFNYNFFEYKDEYFECFRRDNLDKIILLCESLILKYEKLNSFMLKNWMIVFELSLLEDSTKEIFVPIDKVYENSVEYIYGKLIIKNVYITNYRKKSEYSNEQLEYDKPSENDIILYSRNKITNFMGDKYKLNDDYNIEIYSDEYFDYSKKGQLLNYYSLYIPWLFFSILLDFGTMYVFVKRYEKMS
ncbi:hypothetical protein [Spiroplasma tabanidicola]|uniref:Uncharacterized protein n=1 Tax=Spiroplasma tabanidicola TaxID=324079 RepID=A0A6I6CDV3_9MOLU|nr:hypothetical protein [Spiroplasma tabanidicola]QGS52302.1 hypothetical protein STABA_v1c09490 [Spiroplasma tabanidicola]